MHWPRASNLSLTPIQWLSCTRLRSILRLRWVFMTNELRYIFQLVWYYIRKREKQKEWLEGIWDNNKVDIINVSIQCALNKVCKPVMLRFYFGLPLLYRTRLEQDDQSEKTDHRIVHCPLALCLSVNSPNQIHCCCNLLVSHYLSLFPVVQIVFQGSLAAHLQMG